MNTEFRGLKKVHELCRGIQQSSARGKLQEIFTGESGTGFRLGLNREHVPYRWRIESSQFLTPLLLEQEKSRLAQMPDAGELPLNLDSKTKRTLLATHNQILKFNTECLAPLLEYLPNVSNALNPYTDKLKLLPNSEDIDEFPLDPVILSKVAKQFHAHPAIVCLLSRPARMSNFPSSDMEVAVRSMEQQWREVGAMHCGRGYDKLTLQIPLNSSERQNVGFSACLVSLRAMLRILDQLIYQAILDDKPPILDDESVFSIKLSIHATGTGIDLQYQPNELSGLAPRRGDIFLLKAISGYGFEEDHLCEVVTEGFNFGQQTGIIQQPTMRVIDDNLCPFQSYWQRVLEVK